MLIKIMSLPFDGVQGGFDDSPLREFIKGKEIISLSDHFFIKNEIPYLTFTIKYFPHRQEVDSSAQPPSGKRDETWKDGLTESDMGVFNLLREWRSKRSREEGVPPYILFTNKQLAQFVSGKPTSLSDLEKVNGVGNAKSQKYGKDILEITGSQASS